MQVIGSPLVPAQAQTNSNGGGNTQTAALPSSNPSEANNPAQTAAQTNTNPGGLPVLTGSGAGGIPGLTRFDRLSQGFPDESLNIAAENPELAAGLGSVAGKVLVGTAVAAAVAVVVAATKNPAVQADVEAKAAMLLDKLSNFVDKLSSEVGSLRIATKAGNEASTAITKVAPEYGRHVLERMAERGITPQMVEKTLEKGTAYWDPKNGVVNRVLQGGFASGKDLLVGQNPVTNQVTTVIRGTNLVSPRFVPLE